VNTPVLTQHIESLPSLIASVALRQWKECQESVTGSFIPKIERIYLVGCGDSYHASVGSVMAFEQLTGIPTFAQTAMELSRYSSRSFSQTGDGRILVLATSASGEVSRTVEAIDLARRAGATTIAITANVKSSLADSADLVLSTAIPSLPDDPIDIVVPGSRSYIVSLITLYSTAIALGLARNQQSQSGANNLAQELAGSAEAVDWTIVNAAQTAKEASEHWQDAGAYIFCGAGPNYGTALFSAAKFLEASGDHAVGQDLEEWAHLQYFSKVVTTPTTLISGGISDQDRASEIAVAARTIGRRLAIVAPSRSPLSEQQSDEDFIFRIAPIREILSPLLTCIPGLLLASERSLLLGEPYFRDFSGGRSREGGGGISRIRTSNRITKHPD
jgi:glucosamine--fructose-6-phosphate aminotransferase (isomerizing)